MSNTSNIKLDYTAPLFITINEIFVFPDGDFILFQEITNYHSHQSILFDSKTLKPKLNLDIKNPKYFNYFSNDEFGQMILTNLLEFCKFRENRTKYEILQKIDLFSSDFNKIVKISNEDLILFRTYLGRKLNDIFRKRDSKYVEESKYKIGKVDDIIELDHNTFLTYNKKFVPEGLKLKIIDNRNYEVLKKNFIKSDITNHEFYGNIAKRKLYILTDIYKVQNYNKLICGGVYEIFILNINELELETTIKLDKMIRSILLRGNGNLFVLTYETLRNEYNWKYHLKNIKINFQNNDMIQEDEKILNDIGNFITFFSIYNYMENGLITPSDHKRIIIYDNFNI